LAARQARVEALRPNHECNKHLLDSRRTAFAVRCNMGDVDEIEGYEPDEIGEWSERKIAIVSKYATAYASILAGQRLKHYYIDGFTGGPIALRKDTKDRVVTTARRILEIEPAFYGYYLVDADPAKAAAMRDACRQRPQAEALCGDANKLLPGLFEKIKYKEFKRALCFLDPYKIMLAWHVLVAAGKLGTIEAFIHFPTGDIQRNVLRNNHTRLAPAEVERMSAMWGDDSWQKAAYVEQPTLFGPETAKQPIQMLLDAFSARLKNIAGFKYVSKALPMRNSTGVIIYHLLFATHQPLALRIATDVLNSESARKIDGHKLD
jgi:three-Cys-motif partner protein